MATSLKRSKGSQSSLRIGTYSFWVKLSQVGAFNVYSNTVENDNNRGYFQLTSDNKWRMVDNDASGTHIQLRTNRLFRDFNAWYHMVVRVDTTQSTTTDRVRFYVNGVQETSFDQSDYPSQNDDLKIFQGGQTNREYINRIYGGSAGSPNFYLSHFHYADGQSYAPTVFGSTDATTGEWKINTSPTVTYGNQGFFMFKNDASLNDDSGNSNNWTADSGTIQKSEDCPSNIFATLNPLNLQVSSAPTIIKGNNTISAIGDNDSVSTTLGGEFKWYYEAKLLQNPDGSNGYGAGIGACHEDTFNYAGWSAGNYSGFQYSDTKWYSNSLSGAGRFVQGNGNQVIGGLTQATSGDIVGVACDAANGRVYIHINGTYQNSGDPVNGTGFIGGTTGKSGIWFPWFSSDSSNGTVDVNFGNGYFGTTAVSSAGTNASNNGIFEYNVPTGYTALSTKGLNL